LHYVGWFILIFRRFEETDFQNLLSLLRASFDGYPSLELWDWKYNRNPHGSPLIWLAEDKGRIVGCYILNPVKIRIGQNLVMGAQSVDAAVDNAYRGGGIFKKLAVSAITQSAKNGIDLIYAFPNEISYKGQVRIGYRPMFIIPKMHRVFRFGSFLEQGLDIERSHFKRITGVMGGIDRIGKKMALDSNFGLQTRPIKEFGTRFEVFWEEISKQNNSVLVERDVNYLNWRYMKHPEKQYTSYVCEKDNKIVGFAVLNIEKKVVENRESVDKLSVGNIVDLFTLPSMTYAAYPLISAACRGFEDEKIDIAVCWMSKWHPLHSILTKFGFSDYYELLRRVASRSRISSYLIYYVSSQSTINKAIRSMQSQNKSCWWYLMQGDSDFT
jgi:hypothetical protein